MKIHHQIVVLKYDSSKTIVELLAKFIQNKKKSTASRHRNRNIDCSPVAVVNRLKILFELLLTENFIRIVAWEWSSEMGVNE
ncbi:hypothetical protein T02_7134 [Trichinella nativa]|uniref:Uncharacterized protein n=1 Tax=Trichinella nativa TaxID=6335 RepID=A0A0V1LTN9_9BILA|nr:hypothetical protein T02_7134 [Trichinella nativa]